MNINECNLASPIVSGVVRRTANGTTTAILDVATFENELAFISVLPLLLNFFRGFNFVLRFLAKNTNLRCRCQFDTQKGRLAKP